MTRSSTHLGRAGDELLARLADALDGVAQAAVLRLLGGGARRDGVAGARGRAEADLQRAGTRASAAPKAPVIISEMNDSTSMPWAMVPPIGVVFAKASSMWIGLWSPRRVGVGVEHRLRQLARHRGDFAGVHDGSAGHMTVARVVSDRAAVAA